MTPAEMATQFRNLVDDDFDTTHLYQLLSQAKNFVERTEKPEILKKLDSSQVASQGDSYTIAKNLPADFRGYVKMYLNTMEYKPCAFEQQILFRNVGRRFFMNIAANTFSSTGPIGQSGNWNLFYIYKTDDFTEDNEDDDVCVWPEEFHPLIPYQAAKIYQANIDGDQISFVMSAEQTAEYERLLSAFRAWDHDLKLSGLDGRTGFDPSEDFQPEDLGLL